MKVTPVVTCPGQLRHRIGLGINQNALSIIFAQKAGFDKTQTILVFTFFGDRIEMSSISHFYLSDIILEGEIDKLSTDELKSRLVYIYEKWIQKWKVDKKSLDEIFKELITFLSTKVSQKFDDITSLSSGRYNLTLKVRKHSISL